MEKLEKIFNDIEEYNDKIYNEYRPDEKIDFTRMKKNWGVDVIPEEYWIDVDAKYKTPEGYEVVGLKKVLFNSMGKEVTYPIKGTIIKKKNDRQTLEYFIWTLDGRSDIVHILSNNNLIKVDTNV